MLDVRIPTNTIYRDDSITLCGAIVMLTRVGTFIPGDHTKYGVRPPWGRTLPCGAAENSPLLFPTILAFNPRVSVADTRINYPAPSALL